jgi:hypothetical protein
MAYSKTPMQDVYQTKQIPLMETFETRSPDGAKDVVNQNVVWDQLQDIDGPYFEAMKRDGCRLWATIPGTPGAVLIRGMHWRTDGAGVIIATNTNIYFYNREGTQQGAPISVSFALAGGEIVRFTEFLYDDGTTSYIACDSTNCYVIKSGVATLIADADFPTEFLPYPVFLDGYLFIATASGNIHNSDLNDPLTWQASNIITAESYADGLEALARHGQYIAAFGRNSIQFFYDAANPTGTPLAAQTTVPRVGFIGGLAASEDTLYFIGQASNGKESIYYLKSLDPVEITSFPISRRIAADAVEAELEGTWGNIMVFNGHVLYTWRRDDSNGPDTSPTYALDVQTKQWCSLAFQNTVNFRVHSSIYNLDGTSGNGRSSGTLFCFDDSLSIYEVQHDIYQDDGVNFTAQFTTGNQDFGNRRLKFGSRLLLNCDQTPSTSNMLVTWSNDDYQSYVATRTINAASTYPVTHVIGQFRKIAFKVTYADNFPMRWRNLELDYVQGGQ